jgi:hypothetical protein
MWDLVRGRPVIQVVLSPRTNGRQTSRVLLADTGAGSSRTLTDLVLLDSDCRQFARTLEGSVRLGGAIAGRFSTYWMPVSIPVLSFSGVCLVASIPAIELILPIRGIACFRFLNRFTYGNFGDPNRFGLEISE